MAGCSPEHHMDWMGYCLGDCSGAAVLAFKNFELIYGLMQNRRNQPTVNESVLRGATNAGQLEVWTR
jgi:hypothetical protein